MKYLAAVFLFILLSLSSIAQSGLSDGISATEDQLNASTKQLNQFFRRFNGEEDTKGKRLYETDRKYRDAGLRRDYIPTLIDQENTGISSDGLKAFVKEVTDKKNSTFIDLHSDGLMAETSAVFDHSGKEVSILLYMKMQPQGQGYEWIIEDIAYDGFKKMFFKDSSANKKFIHPMSHELEFMTLRKAFNNTDHPEQYTAREYQPDYLSLFLYELKNGHLKFRTVKSVKFHLFSINNWYLEVSKFNRSGYNSGWLISNLSKVSDQQKKLLKDYIYDKN